MTRLLSRTWQIVIDLAVLASAFIAAFLLRFEGDIPRTFLKTLGILLPYVIACQYGFMAFYGVPRFAWRYVGLREVMRIGVALGLGAAVLLSFRLATDALVDRYSYLERLRIPFGVILIDYVLGLFAIGGVRVLRRLQAERQQSRRLSASREGKGVPTFLFGAGQGGVMVAKEISGRPDIGIEAVGFLDDDPLKIGTVVHGLRVLGAATDLPRLTARYGVEQVLITFADAPGTAIRRVADLCDHAGVPAKIIPGLFEIVVGRINLSRIRDVAIEDLLRRDPVALDQDAISTVVRGRTVLVTGAGGSIGSELCRQIARFAPQRLILVERAENNLFLIHRELQETAQDFDLVPCIADVNDQPRIRGIFAEHKPHAVFHAAAHKHVPMMEWNPCEAIKNNLLGTRVVADLASDHGASEFVLISTDKAVNPTSVMGATKRAAELYVQTLCGDSSTRFTIVRFGNVLGSAGSVVPVFKEQIARGGPITVTHPEMRRYFMTIPEACQLVLQAASMAEGGEIFILDMGEPVRIVDLARDLVKLSGLRTDHDIKIEFTGVRPGEKLFEELSTAEEDADKTRHPKIFVGKQRTFDSDAILASLSGLETAAVGQSAEAVIAMLQGMIPEFRPCSTMDPRTPVMSETGPVAPIANSALVPSTS